MKFTTKQFIIRFKYLIIWLFLCFSIKNANAQVQADFTSDKLEGCISLEVNFQSTSVGSNLVYLWTFEPDGSQSTLQNPSKTYLTAGVFGVKLKVTNTVTGQTNTLEKKSYITGFPKPIVNFTVSSAQGCAPFPVTFNDASSSANGAIVSREWTFGNGQIASNVTNPSTVYNALGQYNVFYSVTDVKGCKADKIADKLIRVNPPVANTFTADKNAACTPPLTVTLTPTETNPVYTYAWSIPGVGSQTTRVPTFTINANGSYNVRLLITGPGNCAADTTFINYITINKPQAKFSLAAPLTNDTVCTASTVVFKNESTSGVQSNWDFGFGGGTSTQTNPSFQYTTPGKYTVKLTVTAGSGTNTCTDFFTKNIVVEDVKLNITNGPFTHCKVPQSYSFTTTNTNVDNITWNFGNFTSGTGNTGTGTFTTPGRYNVTATGTTSYGCVVTVKRNNIVDIELPSLTINSDTLLGCINLPVNFTNLITVNDNVTSRSWSFGDGGTATPNVNSTSHTYTTDGDFKVKFTFVTAKGCTLSDSLIILAGKKPKADFSANPFITCAYDSTKLVDRSTVDGVGGKIDFRKWLEPAGEILGDSVAFAVHKIDTGLFDVKFVVGYNGCYDTIVKPNIYRKLGAIARIIKHEINCATREVTFTPYLVDATTVTWDFNADGVIDNTTPGVVKFTYPSAGKYKIYLRGFSVNNNCEYKDSLEITIFSLSSDFSIPTVACPGSTLLLQPTATVTGSTYSWKVQGTEISTIENTSFVLTAPGTYKVSFTAKNSICESVTERFVKVYGIRPLLDKPSATGCKPLDTKFSAAATTADTNIVAYQWYNGVNLISTNVETPNLTFNNSGVFSIRLIITDKLGCVKDTIYNNLITVKSPKADFSVDKLFYCTGDKVKLINKSTPTAEIESYIYTVNVDGGTSYINASPEFVMNTFGNFNVTLKITDKTGCTDEKIVNNLIKVEPTPTIQSLTTPETLFKCFPATQVRFDVLVSPSNYTNYSYTWNLGAGSPSLVDIPDNFVIDTYTKPGEYDVFVSVRSPNGCSAQLSLPKFIVVKGPQADFEIDKIKVCVDEPIRFIAKDKFDVQNYRWDFGDGFIDSVTTVLSDTIFHSYDLPGIKTAIFRSFFEECENPQIVQIEVLDVLAQFTMPNFPTIAERDTLVKCTPFDFVPKNTSIGAEEFEWFFGPGIPSDKINLEPTRTYNAIGLADTLKIQLVVKNTLLGCTDTATQHIIVANYPVITAGVDSILCENETLVLQGNSNGIKDSYKWTPNTDLSNDAIKNPSANPTNDISYSLLTTNVYGCSSTASVNLFRDKSKSDFTITNTKGCESLQFLFADNSFGNNYSWTFLPDGSTSNLVNPGYTFNTIGVNTIRLEVFDKSARCTKTVEQKITIFPKPKINLQADTTICEGGEVKFKVSADNGAATWTPATYLDNASILQATSKPLNDITYTLKITDANSCENSATIVVAVDKSKVDFSLSLDTACAMLDLAFTNKSVGTSFTWDFGNGTTSSDYSPVNVNYTNPGNYTIKLIVFDKVTYCNDTLKKSITVLPIPQGIASPDSLLCIGQSYQLQASGGKRYAWYPNLFLNDSSIANPLASPTGNMAYKVRILDDFGCYDEKEVNIVYKPRYKIQVPKDTTINIGNTVTFDFTTDDDVRYIWTPNKDITCIDCPYITFSPLDTTCYQLITIDAKGCYPDTSAICINVKEEYAIDVPTAFTPNNDGRNDKIFVRGIGVKRLLNFTVYNRWGEVVFTTQDINTGWDGVYKDKIQNDETYLFSVNAEMYNGKVFTKNGYLTLLK